MDWCGSSCHRRPKRWTFKDHSATRAPSAASLPAYLDGFRKAPQLTRSKRIDCVQVLVRDNNVDQALKALKKKMQREGIFREMKLRGHYEKPSEKKARERAEAIRRARKLARKKLQREGLLLMKPRILHGAAGRPGGPGGGGGGNGGGVGRGPGG